MKRCSAVISVSSALVLTACGGGGGGSPTTDSVTSPAPDPITSDASGKVIDGYITGATVFLDLNFNNALDQGEPSTVSTKRGDYRFELTEDNRRCLRYAPIVVDVPVGAIDEDLGEVTAAYQMVLPPALEDSTVSTSLNVTPLTSVVWSAMEAELTKGKGKSALSCGKLLEQRSESDRLKATLENAVDDAVRHYNVSAGQMFSDFIANDDTDAQAKAVAIVKGLKKSLAATAQLKEEHPDALYVRASYHQFDYRDNDAAYPEAWYRETNIVYPSSSKFSLEKVSDDLSETVRSIIYGEVTRISTADFVFSESVEFESRAGDSSPYSCDIKEIIASEANGKTYELVNLISKTASVFKDCQNGGYQDDSDTRYASVGFSDGTTNYDSQFIYTRTVNGFPMLNDWLGLQPKLETLDTDLMISALEGLPYRYDELGGGGADYWFKTKHYANGDNQVRLTKSYEGELRKTVTYPNGTYLTQCSTDGTSWSSCE